MSHFKFYSAEERNFLVLSLYYLSGYIIECSLKFKIFEVCNYDENIDITEEECRNLGINYKKDIRIHNFEKLQHSINIPLSQLRSRLTDLPTDQTIYVYCQVGLRGYLACRILKQHGFNCKNLDGGFKTYKEVLKFL